jgi:hypothetical protein
MPNPKAKNTGFNFFEPQPNTNRTLFDAIAFEKFCYAREYMKFTDGSWLLQPGAL